MFYAADGFNLSWFPTLRAMWSPKGQQVLIPTPGQPDKYYGMGAVNYHTGESVVLYHHRKRRKEIAELLEALVEKHPSEFFETKPTLLTAAQECFDRFNRCPEKILSVIGSKAKKVA